MSSSEAKHDSFFFLKRIKLNEAHLVPTLLATNLFSGTFQGIQWKLNEAACFFFQINKTEKTSHYLTFA